MVPEQRYCYDYPRPALTADIVLVRMGAPDPEVLLIQRGRPPFKGAWALPGGFVEEGEAPEAAARRELAEETALSGEDLTLQQVGAFGDPGRDPRGWVVSIAYAATGHWDSSEVVAASDAVGVQWWPIGALPPLAFDHAVIIEAALQALAIARR